VPLTDRQRRRQSPSGHPGELFAVRLVDLLHLPLRRLRYARQVLPPFQGACHPCRCSRRASGASFAQLGWRNRHFLPVRPHGNALASALAANGKRRNLNLIRVVVGANDRLVTALWIEARYDQPAHTELAHVAECYRLAAWVLGLHPLSSDDSVIAPVLNAVANRRSSSWIAC
jgi:hypothetical protein